MPDRMSVEEIEKRLGQFRMAINKRQMTRFCLDEAIDIIRQLLEERSWQPIETAPTDGTHILYSGEGQHGKRWVSEGRWLTEGWYDANCDSLDQWADEQYPTHWMPLPAPPAIAARKGEEL